jgi:outer membrane receptor for ferrienterochelin and colicins
MMSERRPAGRNRARARWGLVLLLTTAPIQAAANESSRLAGSVVDGSGAAVPGAGVLLRNPETGFERLAQADAHGQFDFRGLSPGRYRLSGHAPGFARTEAEVEAPQASPVRLSLTLAPVVEQVTVVSGSREEELRDSLNTRVDVVTRERIRDTGYETPGEVLREMPGVLTRRGSETSAVAGEQIQGIDSRQVLVLIDGQPLVGARGVKRGAINLDRQSVERLERIEVVKGASSALYGSDAIGGVINLVTRDAEQPFQGSLVASAGSHGVLDGRGAAGFAQGAWHGFFSVERHQNDGFDLFPTTPDTTGAPFRRNDAYGKLRLDASPTFSLTAFANGYWNDSDARVVGELGLQESDVRDDAQNYGLTADWRPSARTTVQARGYFGRYDEISDNSLLAPGAPPIPRDELYEHLGKLDTTVSQVWGDRQLLQVGAEWWRDEYSGANRLRNDEGEDATTSVLWAQDRINLPGRLTLTLGARYDRHSIFASAFSPKAAVNLRVSDGVRLRASYGRGFRAPDLGQLFYRFLNPTNLYQVIGNPALEPEHANSYQFGGEVTARRGRLRLGANVFRNDVRDLIDSVSLGFVATPGQLAALSEQEGIDPAFRPVLNRLLFLYKNVADARTQGLELDGEAVLPGGFSLTGAYTCLDAKDQATGLTLTNRNKHQGVARLAWANRRTGTRANLRGTFYSSWIAARSNSGGTTTDTVAPAFQLWDVYVAQRVRHGVEAFASVDNLADSQDPNTGLLSASGRPLPVYRPEVGRTFRIGVRVEVAQGRK